MLDVALHLSRFVGAEKTFPTGITSIGYPTKQTQQPLKNITALGPSVVETKTPRTFLGHVQIPPINSDKLSLIFYYLNQEGCKLKCINRQYGHISLEKSK
jgi:hypothetical protein